MNNYMRLHGSGKQKKWRSIHDRLFLHYPSGIPACIYPVQIRFRQSGQLPTSAIQSVFLSLIWRSCQSHASLCSIPKLFVYSLKKILANTGFITSFILKKCELVGCKFYDNRANPKTLLNKLIKSNEIADKYVIFTTNVTLNTQINSYES